jgi:hypothetical protein
MGTYNEAGASDKRCGRHCCLIRCEVFFEVQFTIIMERRGENGESLCGGVAAVGRA